MIKFPFWIKSKNRVMTSSHSSPLFHWCGCCWKSLDFVWLDLKENIFDFSKNRLMTSASSRKRILFVLSLRKIICFVFFDKSWGFFKNRSMTSSDSSRMFHSCLSLEKWMSFVLGQRKLIFQFLSDFELRFWF